MKTIGIIGHENPALVRATLSRVLAKLSSTFPNAKLLLTEKMASFERPAGCEVAESLQSLAKASDVIVSIGGDGTMLLAARAIARANLDARRTSPTMLIGVNAGKLGFLSEHPPEEIDALFDELGSGSLVNEERLMLQASLRCDSGEALFVKQDNLDPSREGSTASKFTLDALNEVVIDNYGSTRMLTLEVYVSDALLGVLRADGIMVATPTGSTGYAVSAGGPIVEPNSPVMLITPIAPHSLNVRPVIVPEGATVRVRARAEETREETSPTLRVLVVADGQEQIVVSTPAEIVVRASPRRLHLLRRKERSFFDLLRTKLFWSADSREGRR